MAKPRKTAAAANGDIRKLIGEQALIGRVNVCEQRTGALVVRRTRHPLGPFIALSPAGEVLGTGLQDIGEAAEALGLIRPWERTR